jgi:hypothetical protein
MNDDTRITVMGINFVFIVVRCLLRAPKLI